MADLLTNGEIAVLNAARTILAAHAEDCPNAYGEARACVLAETAKNAIFNYLVTVHTWGGVPMTQEQLHQYPITPESLRVSEPVE